MVLTVAVVLAAAAAAVAQIGPAVTPRFPNVPQVAGRVLSGLNAPQQGRTAIIAYHNGILFTIPEVPASQPGADFQVRTWDIADPAHPIQLATLGTTTMPLNAHGYVHSGDYLIIGPNFPAAAPWSFRANGPFSVQRTSFPGLTCMGPRGCAFQPWFLGPTYTLYNTTSGNALLQLRNNTLASWDHLGLTGVIGHPFILGNLAIFASDMSRTGIATYDISNPGNPVLLDVLTTGGPGGYHPELWGGDGKLYVVLPYRDNGNGFQIVDVTDPSELRFVIDRPLTGTQSMYAQFQDEYAFMGDHKVDLRTFESVLFLDGNNVERPNQPGVVGIDTSQFALPLGNLLVTGGVGPNEGMAIWAQQAEPDSRGPSVGYHIPRAAQTGYPTGAPISLLIHETLETPTIINGQTFIVRPLGGNPLAGALIFSYNDVLTFTPNQPLLANTTYEVVIPAGGIKDAAGNGITGYAFNFSTGPTVGGNGPPAISSLTASSYPVAPGAVVTFSTTAADPDGDPLEYRFDFGDGTPKTAWSGVPSAARSFDASGHYRVVAQTRDPSGLMDTATITATVLNAPSPARPTNSSQVWCDAAARWVWSVDPDNDRLTAVHADSLAREREIAVCDDPRGVAVSAAGALWLACHGEDRIQIVDSNGTQLASLPTGHGSAPVGIAMSPDGSTAWVALEGARALLRFNTAALQQTGHLALDGKPRALAVAPNGTRVFVTRFISAADHAAVWEINTATLALVRTIRIPKFGSAENSDTPASGRGVANYLAGIAITPDGRYAWVASNKSNTERGRVFGPDLDQDNTVRSIVSQIDLPTGRLIRAIDIDNSDSASAVAFSPFGDYMFVTLQGSNEVVVFDTLAIGETAGLAGFVARLGSGLAPQAVCVDAPTNRTFVRNLMSRSLTAIDTDRLLRRGDISVSASDIPTTTTEALPAAVLRGKQIFYNAADPRMSAEGYLSCATCHLDGGHDGRVWDFTGRGEGLRNTTTLHGRAGMAQGNVHWSANFDEIQDFENDVRSAFGGSGFLNDADFAATSAPLGASKAGRSADLDALAAYVASLDHSSVPRSPWRNPDGSMTGAALAGRSVFQNLGCAGCHAGQQFTDSTRGTANLHDVGTLRTTSGQRLGAALTGIDTPTLIGVWDTAPYFHDGSAFTLEEVFLVAGGTLLPAENGSVSNGAGITSQYVELNNDDTVRGRAYVGFGNNGARLTFNNVDGGPGGGAALEIRYSNGYTVQALDVSVNGVRQTVNLPLVGNDPQWRQTYWARFRVDNISLAAGTVNTIQLTATSPFPNLSIDDVLVTTAGNLAAAQPHRQVLGLPATDRAGLIAYLQQIDGAAEQGAGPTATLTAGPASTATALPSFTPTAAPSLTAVAPTRTNTALPSSTPTRSRTATATLTAVPSSTATASATPSAGGADIGGQVLYFGTNHPVADVRLHLSGAGSANAMSGADGSFGFAATLGADWRLNAAKDGDFRAALSALDAAYALQGAVGLRDLSPQQRIAADSSGDGRLTAIDATFILQNRVGMLPRVPIAQRCGSDWAFWPAIAAPAGERPIAPAVPVCELGGIAWEPLLNPVYGQNLEAILFGDVTGSWLPPGAGGSASRGGDPPVVRIGGWRRNGRSAWFSIAIAGAPPFNAFEIDLSYDPKQLRLREVAPHRRVATAPMAVNDVSPRLSIALASPVALSGDLPQLLTLRFEAIGTARRLRPVRVAHAAVDERRARLSVPQR